MTVEQIAELFSRKKYMLEMGAGKLSRWLDCTKEDIYKAREIVRSGLNRNRFPKILVFDIETSHLRASIWSRCKQNIYMDQTIS